MKNLVIATFAFLIAIGFAAVVSAQDFEGTYMGTYKHEIACTHVAPDEMIISFSEAEGGYATFYKEGRRQLVPIVKVGKPDRNGVVLFTVDESATGGSKRTNYKITLAGDTLASWSAFNGTLTVKRVGKKPCPIDKATRKISAPC